MVSRTITIINPTGLHTRPAADFIEEARKFNSAITIEKGDKKGNAKSLIKLLKIGISQGDTIQLTAEGNDEQEAIDGLTIFLSALRE
jgi:phosphotransferase system HPr (HPr) family protein